MIFIIGWLYDVTQSYDPGFYLAGTMIAISGLMLFVIPYIHNPDCREQNEKPPQQSA